MESDIRRRPIEEQSFEEVYPQYEFAPLVHLALAAAAWMKGRLEKKPPARRPATNFRPAAR